MVTYADHPGDARLRRREQLAGQRPRGRRHERAAHGAVVVPEPTTTRIDKAIVDVRITRAQRPRGDLQRRARRADASASASTTWHWRADEPMAPYLAFFAAGDFTIAQGVHRRAAVARRGLAAAQPGRRGGQHAPDAARRPTVVAGLEKDLGDYPFSVVGGLTTSLNVGFALENQTRPTYPAVGGGYTSLDRARARPPVVRRRRRRPAVARHLAQRGLRDLHGVALVARQHGGRSAADDPRRLLRQRRRRRRTSGRSSSPTRAPTKVFDDAVYGRGAMTLQALRNRVGDDDFWRDPAHLDPRAGTAATARPRSSRRSRPGSAARTSTGFFTAWLRTPAKPAATADNGLA